MECGGHPALGTAGSGDVLAGLVAGLAARDTAPLDALLWAVHAHAAAGATLAGRHGGVGLLARELLDVLPMDLNRLRREARRTSDHETSDHETSDHETSDDGSAIDV